MSDFTIRKTNLFYGGTYCTSIKEQARILAQVLNNAEKACLQQYIDDSSINFIMRKIKTNFDAEYINKAKETIEKMLNIFDKMHLYTPPKGKYIYLYRGVNVDYDQAITDCGFMSTSTKLDIAKEFGSNVFRIILLNPYPYQILPLEKIAETKGEFEVLLAPNLGKFYPIKLSGEMRTYIYLPNDHSHPFTDDPIENKRLFKALNLKREKAPFFSNLCRFKLKKN